MARVPLRTVAKRHGISKATPHSLRHTNATLLIAAGTDLRTIHKRLGHAQTSTTSNIYAHAIRSADEAATETIENILDPVKPLVRIEKQ
jgi:integrase